MIRELRRLFAYNRWANLRMLEALEALTPEELSRDMEGSFPSVTATLVHLMGAEWVWMRRWSGSSPTAFPPSLVLDSVAAVRREWSLLWEEQQAFLADLDDEALRARVTYTRFDGSEQEQPMHEILRHVVNHSTYHRGQVATMLRQLGHTPPGTDLVTYYRMVAG